MSTRMMSAIVFGALLSCSAAPEDNPPDSGQMQTPDDTTQQSLTVEEDGVVLRGFLDMQAEDIEPANVSIALRWNIPDRAFPRTPTTTAVEPLGGDAKFTTRTDVMPPPEALALSESNGRAGLAIAYVIAYIDRDGDSALGCRNPGCDDVFVGASPNTLVLFGDPEELTDFSPLFAFDGAPGIVPKTGWSLVHLVPNACEERPTARDWDDATDSVEVVVIGDFLDKQRCEVRAVNPDID